MTFPANEAQVDDIAKGADPTTHIRILGSDGWRTVDRETAGVMSRRVGRIQKGLLPPFDVCRRNPPGILIWRQF